MRKQPRFICKPVRYVVEEENRQGTLIEKESETDHTRIDHVVEAILSNQLKQDYVRHNHPESQETWLMGDFWLF